jgi:class 3 adenylate cyclase
MSTGVAWGLFLLGTALAGVGITLLVLDLGVADRGLIWGSPGFNFAYPLGFAAVGLILAARRPRNPIGWIFLGMGVLAVLQSTAGQYAVRALVAAPGELPFGRAVGWMSTWVWIPASFALGLVFLIFPTGSLLSARWRPVAWLVVAYAVATTVVAALASGSPGSFTADEFVSGTRAGPFGPVILGLSIGSGPLIGVCVASLVVRFHRARGDERAQLRWVALAAVPPVLALVPAFLLGDRWIQDVLIVAIVGVPAAAAIAILKYHLYDIELVINRAVVYGMLAVAISAVYVIVAVGIGALAGSRGRPNLALSLLAAALVAVGFQPARARLQHLANRLVYGKRSTPYEVLSDFSGRMASTGPSEDILPGVARLVAEAIGAAEARVWLREGDVLRPEAFWPPAALPAGPLELHGADLADAFRGSDPRVRLFPVEHQGELLGVITVRVSASEPLTVAGQRLIADLAAQTALVVHFEHMKERALYARALASFLPPAVAAMVERSPSALSLHQEVEATIVFSDIRGFSALAEQLSPSQVADVVGRHLAAMAAVVDDHEGTLDKFAGDAVMAVFGAPRTMEDHAGNALACARAMQRRQAVMNAEAKRAGMPCFEIGIGLNTGTVIAGTLGGRGRLDYTVLGDAVNVAQRLQSEAGPGEILAAAATVHRAGEPDAHLLGRKRLKGRREPVETYQVCWNVDPRQGTSASPGRTPPPPLRDPAAS